MLTLMAAAPQALVQAADWSAAGSLTTGRENHTATLLLSGKVLVAGGYNGGDLASTELYDPVTNTWNTAGNLATARSTGHTATLLPSGKVLVVGGIGNSYFLANAELYDPVRNAWSSAGNLVTARYGHTTTLLPNGKVLVSGGNSSSLLVANAELYEPATNTWSFAGNLFNARYLHTSTLLSSGKVLVVGGQGNIGPLASVEIYDPATNAWSAASSLTTARKSHTTTLLFSDKVLAVGGLNNSGNGGNAELYDPVTNAWSAASSLVTARFHHTATLLTSGKVLVAGGQGGSGFLTNVELYNPTTNVWSYASDLFTARSLHTSTLLSSGKVLVVAGTGNIGYLSNTELYAQDTITETPTLLAPTNNAATSNPVSVSFSLPEAALAGSVKLSFGATVLTLAGSQESSGAHTFTFNPANPTASLQVASGMAISDGVYAVTLHYQDALGNPEATETSTNVRIDTIAPTFSLPANITAEATGGAGAVVSYTASASDTGGSGVATASFLPASGGSFAIGMTTVNASATDHAGNVATGTFNVTVQDTTAPVVAAHANVTVEATSAAGATVDYEAATATDVVTMNPAITYSKASGTTFPLGVTTVTVTAKDAANNAGTKTFTVTVQDTTAPTISGTFTPLTVFAGTLPDYRSQAVKSDAVGVTSVMQSPLQGSATTVGTVPVTLTATDAAGLTATTTFDVAVRPVAPVHTTHLAKGDHAPSAGVDGLPADAIFASFGPPATADGGSIAFVGKWTSNGGKVKGTGLFLNDRCYALVGGAASVAGVKYTGFSDPVVEGSQFVSIAKLSNGGSEIISNFNTVNRGTMARTGAVAADAGDAKWKSFKAVALRGSSSGSLGFLAQLTGGTGASKVTAANDWGVWVREPGDALHLVYRDGFDLGNSAEVASFASFQPGIGSPGQGRGWLSHNQQGLVLSLNTFTDKSQAIVFGGNGGDTFLARTGAVGTNFAPALAGASFVSFRYPAMNDALANTFYATMKVGGGGAVKADAGGIFASTADFGGSLAPYALIARIGKDAGTTGTTFNALGDPVLSQDGGIAFPAKLKATKTVKGSATTTLWWKPPGEALQLLAQGGAPTVGDLPSAQWKSFETLAIAGGGRGPIFAATLVVGKGGVTAKTASGVWACDFTGAPRALFRTGDTITGKTLKSFTLLKATVGNMGVTRSLNDTAQVVWLATFADKSTAIVTTEVP